MKNYLLLCVVLLTGCASAGMNGLCGRITGTGLTVPYIGGKANVDGYSCHMGCVGMKCPQPDYVALQKVMSDYMNTESTSGKIAVSGPGTITQIFTPSK